MNFQISFVNLNNFKLLTHNLCSILYAHSSTQSLYERRNKVICSIHINSLNSGQPRRVAMTYIPSTDCPDHDRKLLEPFAELTPLSRLCPMTFLLLNQLDSFLNRQNGSSVYCFRLIEIKWDFFNLRTNVCKDHNYFESKYCNKTILSYTN